MEFLPELLGSQTRAALLEHFFAHPGEDFSIRGASRRTGQEYRNVRSELDRLEKLGILRSRRKGRARCYALVPSHPAIPSLRELVLRTAPLGALRLVLMAVEEEEGIQAALVFGSIVTGRAGPKSDVDVLLLGAVDELKWLGRVRTLERQIGREVNCRIMDPMEFRERRRKGDPFLEDVLSSPVALLKGGELLGVRAA